VRREARPLGRATSEHAPDNVQGDRRPISLRSHQSCRQRRDSAGLRHREQGLTEVLRVVRIREQRQKRAFGGHCGPKASNWPDAARAPRSITGKVWTEAWERSPGFTTGSRGVNPLAPFWGTLPQMHPFASASEARRPQEVT